MFSIGKVVVKVAGRDAGKTGIITEVIDERYVMIAGETRKRKCNIKHLELTGQQITLSGNVNDESAIITALQKIDSSIMKKKQRSKSGSVTKTKDTTATAQKSPRPRRMHKQKSVAEKPVKKTTKSDKGGDSKNSATIKSPTQTEQQ